MLPGTSPPQNAKSVSDDPTAAASFAANDGPSIVGGWAFSGMSTKHVPPPAATARLPDAKPSQSVRPGSLKWTCASTTPGRTWSPLASISSAAARSSAGPTATTCLSQTATSAWTRPACVTIVPPRTMVSQSTSGEAQVSCHSPPRSSGTALPSAARPSTSTSRPPIMKSVCTTESLYPSASRAR